MKNIFKTIATLCIGLMAFCSCESDEPIVIDMKCMPPIFSEEELFFEATASSRDVTITTQEKWTIESSDEWITVSPSSGISDGIITISVTENPTTQVRRSSIVVCTDSTNRTEVLFISQATDVPASDYPCDNSQYVDLGLSVNWATYNIGASKPEEYGNYYCWGEIESFNRDASYKFYINNDEKQITKYCTNSDYGTVDNLVILEKSDDIASVTLGGNWRIPTKSEWEELITKCTWTWSTINGGVNGYIISASNGNSIFLPAAGAWGYRLFNDGIEGDYWASTLDEAPNYANRVYFTSNPFHCVSRSRRDFGNSIRAVCDK